MTTTNILAIEDDIVDQMALRRLFAQEQSLGELTIVGSVFEAQQQLDRGNFQAILLDYHLGIETGFDALEFVGDLPVIFITGTANIEIAVKAIKAGAYDFLVKDANNKHLSLLPTTLRGALARKQAERELRESRKMIERLEAENLRIQIIEQTVRDISHDVRTPLTVLQTAAYVIRRELQTLYNAIDPLTLQTQKPNIDKINMNLDYISWHVRRIQAMLLRMLEMAQLDEKPEFEWETINLNDLCKDTASVMLPLLENRRLTIGVHLQSDLPTISGDKLELSAALVNLLENAMKYTPPEGVIRLTTRYDDNAVFIDVADTGIGIAPEHLPHIFERFYRVDKSRSSATGGFGLGLAKVHRVIELHGGLVTVESTPGVGTTFHIRLPRAKRVSG